MADTKDKSVKKRIVKNPETFRERAVKASEEDAKPSRSRSITRPIGSVLATIFRPIGKVLKALNKIKVFRFLGKILFPTYFRDSWKELKQVRWPNRTESRQLTFAVLLFAVIFGVTIAIVDYGLDKVFRNVLLK